MVTGGNPLVKQAFDCIELPPHQNLIYWPCSTTSLEQPLRAIWGAVSWDAVLILPQIKLNSQRWSCIFFLVKNPKSDQQLSWLFHKAVDKESSKSARFLWLHIPVKSAAEKPSFLYFRPRPWLGYLPAVPTPTPISLPGASWPRGWTSPLSGQAGGPAKLVPTLPS